MDAEVFERKFAAEVERSFRDDAIRTAVLIDDQFPTYSKIRDAQKSEFSEIERACSIYDFLHEKGLICDVQNLRTLDDADLQLRLLDKARKSDLILLDYQLGLAGSKAALTILRHLATSDHFNLVVLYSGAASPEVTYAVAAAMRGLAKPDHGSEMTEEESYGVEEVLKQEEFAGRNNEQLGQYLVKQATPWAGLVAAALKEHGLSGKLCRPVADQVARRWISSLLGEYEPERDPVLQPRFSADPSQVMWVHCGSCFVAIVPKMSREDEGQYIWEELGKALRAWKPNLYRLILSEIQNALELETVTDHDKWLDDNLCLGLGLYLLESDAAAEGRLPPADLEGSAHSLIDRFVDLIRRRLASHQSITSKATELLSDHLSVSLPVSGHEGEKSRRSRAMQLARVSTVPSDNWHLKILPAVNAFMVSDAFRGSHITTGTVIRDVTGIFWLCTTPACDLVPREAGPVVVQLMKLQKEGPTLQTKFTPGEHLVINGEAGPIVLRALSSNVRQPSLSLLILPSGTRARLSGPVSVISGCLVSRDYLTSVYLTLPAPTEGLGEVPPAIEGRAELPTPSAGGNEAAALTATPSSSHLSDFEIVAQLRSGFATRFLMSAGQHLSRVGVDFVDP